MTQTMIEVPAFLVLLIGIVLAAYLIAKLPLSDYTGKPPPLATLQGRMGMANLNGGLFFLGLFFWIVLFAVLFAGLILSIYDIVYAKPPVGEDAIREWRFILTKITALTGVLGAVVALPFTLIRLDFSGRQTKASEEGLITDRLNKAVNGLGQEKTVKHQRVDQVGNKTYEKAQDGTNDYSKPVMIEESAPNLEVRIGAIYALERIAQDSPRDHVQIMEILCAYVRENSPNRMARLSPHEVFDELTENTSDGQGLSEEAAFQHSRYKTADTLGINPTELDQENLTSWATTLPQPRLDIQAVLTVIGRRSLAQVNMESQQGFKIDLRDSNLQHCRLSGHFENADFLGSRLDGAILDGAFKNCDLTKASLQAVKAWKVDLSNSNLSATNLAAAYFGASDLAFCRLWLAKMRWTNFNGAKMIGSDWFSSFPSKVYFHQDADATHARFQNTDVTELKGFAEGPSKQLWGCRRTKIDQELQERFTKLSTSLEPELDFRREWLSSLKELGLKPPTFWEV